jgi:hypothetical protein
MQKNRHRKTEMLKDREIGQKERQKCKRQKGRKTVKYIEIQRYRKAEI